MWFTRARFPVSSEGVTKAWHGVARWRNWWRQRPGGDHFFAHGDVEREYSVLDEKMMFGISRQHMRAYYFFDETGSVVSTSVTFPYEQREKLLGALTLSFGPYLGMQTKGISTFYLWKRDDGTTLSLRATLDPTIGILELGISGPNSMLLKTVFARLLGSSDHAQEQEIMVALAVPACTSVDTLA